MTGIGSLRPARGARRRRHRVGRGRGVRGAGSNMTGGGPRPRMETVNIGRLSAFPAGSEVTPETLRQARLVREAKVKILGDGELGHPLVVRAHAFSKSARERIEAAGGRAEVIPLSAGGRA